MAGAYSVEVIVVVDGPSSNGDHCFGSNGERLVSKLYTGGRSGPGAARNLGARITKAPVLCFLDDDIVIGTGFVGSVITLSELCIGQGVVLNVNHHRQMAACSRARRYRSTWLSLPEKLKTKIHGKKLHWWQMATCALLVDRARFLELGGFDESFRQAHYEDLEFSARFYKAGCTLRLARQPRVQHQNFRNMGQQLEWSVRNGFWKHQFCQLHPDLCGDVLRFRRGDVSVDNLLTCKLSDHERASLASTLKRLDQQPELNKVHERLLSNWLARLSLDFECRSFLEAQQGHSLREIEAKLFNPFKEPEENSDLRVESGGQDLRGPDSQAFQP